MFNHIANQIAGSAVGSTLLAQLELRERIGARCDNWDSICDAIAVEAAVNYIKLSDFSNLVNHICRAVNDASPWNSTNTIDDPFRYSFVEKRLPIAEALIQKFYYDLTSKFELNTQEIWKSRCVNLNHKQGPISEKHNYGQGEFTWSCIRSITTPDSLEILDWILSARGRAVDHICYKPVVSKELIVYEIHSFDDWYHLIENHSNPASGPTEPLEPEWESIFKKYHAVHLSWMGILLAHDNLKQAENNNVIPLRYWEHEQTHWSSDCIDEYKEISTYAAIKDSYHHNEYETT